MTATAREVSQDRLDRRIALAGPRDELRELADTFDAMLDRLQDSFDGQRRFVANASHELRSPLTLIRAEADVALANPDADEAELRAMARPSAWDGADGAPARGPAPARALPARPVAPRAARPARGLRARGGHVRGRPRRPGSSCGCDASARQAMGDAELLGRLVENLLENGVRHNRPGAGWRPARLGPRGEAMLEVSNSGPRIAPDAVRRLTEPFERLGRRADGRGAGLGLSIVRSVADAHGGDLAITAREAGGLAVRITLPPARS
jgi:signal transduction histidine kinase